ncbi:cilia- and flagella-associated protein 119 isoform X1 [Oncorhynchus kisutch]|uniref:cilia- and flagella-associated protein 119 isoform X1 n=1 Tax=Oncorhynchus kisutch TaxID=8019 RepID=UPI0012DDD648|nr:coiled-coil domain-containing protein 189 isoform X1 [Oncorhynchus kisutch]
MQISFKSINLYLTREMNLAGKIKEPDPLNPKVLLWADVSYSDMEEIENTKAIPELERSLSLFVATHTKSRTLWLTGYFLLRTLCCVLGVNIPEPRRRVLLELYVHTVLFCRESNFNREQTSVLLSIVKSMHQANTETPLNNMGHCYAYCSELLLCHSVRRPPFSISLFSSEDVTQILKYLLNTYFRHYNLYKYIFTPQVRLDMSFSYSGMPDEDPVTETVSSDGYGKKENEPETAEGEQPIEAMNTGPEVANTDPSPKSELRTIIQQEMREEMIHMSRQLEQRLKESADRLNSALTSLETNLQGKK